MAQQAARSATLTAVTDLHLYPHSEATKDNFKKVMQHPHLETLFAALAAVRQELPRLLVVQDEEKTTLLQPILEGLLKHSETLLAAKDSLACWKSLVSQNNSFYKVQGLLALCEEQKLVQAQSIMRSWCQVKPQAAVVPTEPGVKTGEGAAWFDQKSKAPEEPSSLDCAQPNQGDSLETQSAP